MNKNKKGFIILLNGVTSSGKTSIAKEIINISDENYYYVAIDTFATMANPKYLTTFESYFSELNDCISAMYSAANTFAHLGKNVILDTILLDTPEYPMVFKRLQNACEGINIFTVNVTCSLDICIKRHKDRGNYNENQPLWPQWQSERLLKIEHNMTVDTTDKSANDCANSILHEVQTHIH
jgi:chloramphenicol 3-O-phosphotransferase